VLKEHGVDPAPKRCRKTSWTTFINGRCPTHFHDQLARWLSPCFGWLARFVNCRLTELALNPFPINHAGQIALRLMLADRRQFIVRAGCVCVTIARRASIIRPGPFEKWVIREWNCREKSPDYLFGGYYSLDG
jgi:hypothetical protein